MKQLLFILVTGCISPLLTAAAPKLSNAVSSCLTEKVYLKIIGVNSSASTKHFYDQIRDLKDVIACAYDPESGGVIIEVKRLNLATLRQYIADKGFVIDRDFLLEKVD